MGLLDQERPKPAFYQMPNGQRDLESVEFIEFTVLMMCVFALALALNFLLH